MEKRVFHLPLNDACTHYGDIVYSDDDLFNRNEKRALRDFIWNKLLPQSLALDESKDVTFETSRAIVRILMAVHPEWHRYKTIEGFVEVEEPMEEIAEPEPDSLMDVMEEPESNRLKTFSVILQFTAVRQEELADRHVFYRADGQVLAFFLKTMGVSAIIEGDFLESDDKSCKKLLKNLMHKKR